MKYVRTAQLQSAGIYAEKGGRDYPEIFTTEWKIHGIGSFILLSVWR